ncbi:cytochrome P450 [Virgibacillus phasianinus]|uniref:Cytochrome P450 n=1 Tax=Virgibacillus phasianinus TaxID=2017483 RepID=A0A220U1G3_9BACI|nr:cytochrome P450 [Virgibacillus phasianinus]ASK61917.1 cytochrome P450 [Virgibacillus phasianinus]
MSMQESNVPHEKGLDNSIKLLTEGYHYIPNRCRRFDSDIFTTHLLGQKVVCISGSEAAKVFYNEEIFRRKGAAPIRVQKTLFGQNGVQTMDNAEHKHRKQLFMSLMTAEHLDELRTITTEQWQYAIDKWVRKNRIIFFKETQEIMCRIACQWAGVPLWAKELKQRANDFGSMIDAFGAVGPRFQKGKRARKRAEKWIRTMIKQVRSGQVIADEHTALYAMSWRRNLNGKLMSRQMAAVELINILRPIVAIARYVTFGALALHLHPETRRKLQSNENDYSQMFVQEVRRFYPFGPFLGARVRKRFTWRNHDFKEGTLVLLDIYGPNHSSAIWESPNEFNPERFRDFQGSPFNFIPQGGGDYMGHRCAGEWVTVEVMKTSLNFLTNHVDYKVPRQNAKFSMIRMPTIPKSRFIIKNVRWN